MSNQQFLITSLYEIGAIQFGEFKLKSGQISKIYINLRKIISYPAILKAVAKTMWDEVNECQFDLLCGVPYTALPIATCMSLEHNIPMILRRKERKDYGTKQLIEGDFRPEQTCLIIEDVITSGSSVLETAEDLESEGLKIKDVIVLIDREQGGKSNIEKKYRLHALLKLSNILQTLLDSTLINSSERFIIEQFLLARSAS